MTIETPEWVVEAYRNRRTVKIADSTKTEELNGRAPKNIRDAQRNQYKFDFQNAMITKARDLERTNTKLSDQMKKTINSFELVSTERRSI